jgi:hypothetical protein
MSRSCFLSLVSGAVLMAVLVPPAGASSSPSHHSSSTKSSSSKPHETYAVIQIGEEYKVISQSQISSEQKRVADKYTQDMKSWKDSKKKDKGEKPEKLTVKVLKRSLRTQQDAQEYCDKLKEKKDDAAAKK